MRGPGDKIYLYIHALKKNTQIYAIISLYRTAFEEKKNRKKNLTIFGS